MRGTKRSDKQERDFGLGEDLELKISMVNFVKEIQLVWRLLIRFIA